MLVTSVIFSVSVRSYEVTLLLESCIKKHCLPD